MFNNTEIHNSLVEIGSRIDVEVVVLVKIFAQGHGADWCYGECKQRGETCITICNYFVLLMLKCLLFSSVKNCDTKNTFNWTLSVCL